MPNIFNVGNRNDYAESNHNHDGKYAKLEHIHDELICNHENAKMILLHKMPEATAEYSVYFGNLLKQICRDYPNTIDGIFVCVARPSLKGICLISIYNTNEVNSEGLPLYSVGMFFPLSIANQTYKFGTYDYKYESKYI